MTAEESALAQELIQAFMARIAKKPAVDAATKSRLIAARDELTAIIALMEEPGEQEKPVEPPKPEPVVTPIPIPASIEAAEAAAEPKKKSKWGWLKKATPWLIAGGTAVATGGVTAVLPVAVDAITSALGAGGTAGVAVTLGGLALEAGKALVKDKPKE